MNIESKGVMVEEVKRNNNGIFIAIIVVLLAIIAGLLFMILNKDNDSSNNQEKPNNSGATIENEKEEIKEENISNKIKIKNSLENIYKDLMNGTPRTDVGIDNGNADFKMVSGNMESFEVIDIKKRTNTCATVDDYQITFKYKCKNNSHDCIYVEQIGTEQNLDNNYYQLTQYFEIDENYNITKFKGNGMLSFNPNCKIEIKDVD